MAQQLEGDELRYTSRAPARAHRQVSLWNFTHEVVQEALADDVPALDARSGR